MGKFGIGARVRDREGDEGVITAKRKGERYVLYDDTDYGSIWNAKERLTALGVVANDNEVSACAPVFEKEYSVGDRVRVKTREYGEKQFGKIGAVIEIDRPSSLSIEIEYDEPLLPGGLKRNQYKPEDLEPIEPAVAPTTGPFAKGDRALSQSGDYVTIDTDPDEVGHVWVSFGKTKWRTPASWLAKWEPKVGDVVAGTLNTLEYTVTAVNEDGTLNVSTPGSFNNVYDYQNKAVSLFRPLPVAEQPAAETALWAPVAGKYGKTRDGRKVGPIEDRGRYFAGEVDFTTYHFAKDGRSGTSGNADSDRGAFRMALDLVAEWVEPVAEAEPEVAVAEATATPLKVGDRVVLVKDGLSTTGAIGMAGVIRTVSTYDGNDHPYQIELDAGGTYKTRAAGPEQYRWTWAAADALTLEPAAPQAKFKVGDRVNWTKHRHAWQGGVVTSVDDSTWPVNVDHPSDGKGAFSFDELELEPAPTLPIGSTVTFTASGRLSAINDNGHMQVTFPDLAPAQNSFALPARYVSAA